MKPFLILISLFTFCRNAHAHSKEQYVKTKDGITLFCLISYSSIEEQKIQDAFLDRLIEKLRRKDKGIPIFLITDQFPLFFGRREWFASISYDTLRSPDPMFLEDYFHYRMGPYYRERILKYSKPPSNKYKNNLPVPIDLGSTYDDKTAAVGLKIMYDYGVTDSATGWDRLYSLVQYAIDHVDEIKSKQKKIVLPYPVIYLDTTSYTTEVSFLTIDTSLIQNIPLLNFGFDHTKVTEEKSVSRYIQIGIFVIALLIIIAFIRRRTNA